MFSFIRLLFSSSYGKDKPKFFFWYPEGTTKAEKLLLHKIDFFILTYGCLGYFAKWLDQANLSNAYVSGMKEDLGMYGKEFNYATTCFQVGTIIGGIPANLLLTRVPPRFLLPGCELIWAILTICTYKVTSYNQVSNPKYPAVVVLTEAAVSDTIFHRLPRRNVIRWHAICSRLMVQTERTQQTNINIHLRSVCWNND
jgi:hypothetical protein